MLSYFQNMKVFELLEAFDLHSAMSRMNNIAVKTGVKDICSAKLSYHDDKGEGYDTIAIGLLFQKSETSSPEKVKEILPAFLKGVVKEFAVDEIQISSMIKKVDFANATLNPSELSNFDIETVLPKGYTTDKHQRVFAMHINFLIVVSDGVKH